MIRRSISFLVLFVGSSFASPALAASDATATAGASPPAEPVREVVEGALPQVEASVLPQLVEAVPSPVVKPHTAPAPTRPSAGTTAAGKTETSGQGSSPVAAETGEQGARLEAPEGPHLGGAVSEARRSSAAAPSVRDPAASLLAPSRATSSFAIPDPAPPETVAPSERPAASPVENPGRSRPVALSDWIGSGPPLPPAFIYLAVFASVLAIVVSMRHELGIRRRRRF